MLAAFKERRGDQPADREKVEGQKQIAETVARRAFAFV